MTVIDVDEADFETEVLQRSAELPVVVDFWAPWCAPCRQLGPVLEKAAEAREGQVVLVKIDTDENPGIAQQFDIQGIPAVKAFVDGEVAAEFVGAQGPSQVEAFFDGLVPTEAKQLLDAGDEASLRKVLELEPANPDANLKLAQMRYRAGDPDARARAAAQRRRQLRRRRPRRADRARAPGRRPPRASARRSPSSTRATPRPASTSCSTSSPPATPSGEDRERLRKVIVAVLDELGVQHPLARESRRRLAAALY